MTARNMPGFTAEASLDEKGRNYRRVAVFSGDVGGIVPAALRRPRFGLPIPTEGEILDELRGCFCGFNTCCCYFPFRVIVCCDRSGCWNE